MTADLDHLLGYKTKSVVIIDQASLGVWEPWRPKLGSRRSAAKYTKLDCQ